MKTTKSFRTMKMGRPLTAKKYLVSGAGQSMGAQMADMYIRQLLRAQSVRDALQRKVKEKKETT